MGMSTDKGAVLVIDGGVFDHSVDVPDFDVVVIVCQKNVRFRYCC